MLKGALATTFTASQGLLLMLPNMFKIAGELTPTVIHVAARTVATHALSIFGDHSDVMAARPTGWAMLASSSVQEAHDFALVAHAATLASRVPFLHFFDGFRTSHEVAKIQALGDDDLRALIDDADVAAHRDRGLSPDRPRLRGSAQNPDVFFQAREAINPFYAAVPGIVQAKLDTPRRPHRPPLRPGRLRRRPRRRAGAGADGLGRRGGRRGGGGAGRRAGSGSACSRCACTGRSRPRPLPRRSRPRCAESRCWTGPRSRARLASRCTRTWSPPSPSGPPAGGAPMPMVIGGRYGLASKEFTPAMAKAVLDELAAERPRNHFTVGIVDDVSHTSLAVDGAFATEDPDGLRAVFYGLGSDGTVGANKTSVKIIGEGTDRFAQGYFVLDSKKSGSVTVSHLRIASRPIRSTYLIGQGQATFVACHQFHFLDRMDVLGRAAPGATFLLNSPWSADQVWDHLPRRGPARRSSTRASSLWVVDAARVARDAGMGHRINTVMQPCFFALSGVLPRDQAIAAIKALDREGLQPPGRGGGGPQLRRRRRRPGGAARGARCRPGRPAPATARPTVSERGARLRQAGHRPHAGGQRRPAAGQRPARRRRLPDRDGPVGEALAGRRDPHLGPVDLHRLRQVRHRLPALDHPHQGVRPRGPGRAPRTGSHPRISAPATCPG